MMAAGFGAANNNRRCAVGWGNRCRHQSENFCSIFCSCSIKTNSFSVFLDIVHGMFAILDICVTEAYISVLNSIKYSYDNLGRTNNTNMEQNYRKAQNNADSQ